VKTILVATDGSKHAEKALDLACDLAAQHGASLKLLHVLMADKEPAELLGLPALKSQGAALKAALESAAAAPTDAVSAEEVMQNPGRPMHLVAPKVLEELGRMVLTAAKEQASGRGLSAEMLPIVAAKPAEAILTAAKSEKADSIVMGCRGLGEIQAISFGSVSQQVCRGADCTCIAVT
jgi:nucleotide-binding universal stress UspA family protein